MAHDWILDVLADLRTFAGKNGLNATERELDRLMVVATAELASGQGMMRGISDAGGLHRPVAAGGDT